MMNEVPKDCFSCSNAHVTDEDELFCIVHEKIVKDENTCDEYN